MPDRVGNRFRHCRPGGEISCLAAVIALRRSAEREYLAGLREVLAKKTVLMEGVSRALNWLSPSPRILFSNAKAQAKMPAVLSGLCVRFSYEAKLYNQTFWARQEEQLAAPFKQSAEQAESHAHIFAGRNIRNTNAPSSASHAGAGRPMRRPHASRNTRMNSAFGNVIVG